MPRALAAQLYTLRDFARTPAEIAQALRRVRQIGYPAVQVSGLGPIDAGVLRRMLDDVGLTCCATHETFESLRDAAGEMVARHRALGCAYTAVPSIPEGYRTAEGYRQFARELSEVAARYAGEGLRVGYHNHHFEFEKFGGRTGMEILVEETETVVHFELDTYWVQAGGADPAAWLERVRGRAALVHLKDMVQWPDEAAAAAVKRAAGETDEAFAQRVTAARGPKAVMAEVGEGNMNWPAILAACERAGVEWYIVEQDLCQRDPFESLAISLRNLRGWE